MQSGSRSSRRGVGRVRGSMPKWVATLVVGVTLGASAATNVALTSTAGAVSTTSTAVVHATAHDDGQDGGGSPTCSTSGSGDQLRGAAANARRAHDTTNDNDSDDTVSCVTVTYDWNYAGSTSVTTSESQGSDAIAQAPSAPNRTGYTFVGWSASSTGTSPLSSYTVTGAVTLYAIWTANPPAVCGTSSGDTSDGGDGQSPSLRSSHENTNGDNDDDDSGASCANFSVAKSASVAGNVITYTITATNGGTGASTVSVTDSVPAGTSYVAGSATHGATITGSSISWTSPTVVAPNGGTASFSFQVDVTNGSAAISNTADWTGPGCATSPTTPCTTNPVTTDVITLNGNGGTVDGSSTYYLACASGTSVDLTGLTLTPPSGDTFSGWTDSNGHAVSSPVSCSTETLTATWAPTAAANFSVTKTSTTSGSTITYTITATNNGNAAGTVTVTDNVPAGTSILGPSVSNGATVTGSTISWTSPSVAPTRAASFSFQVYVTNGSAAISNTANWTGPGCATSPTTPCTTNTVTTDVITLDAGPGTVVGSGMRSGAPTVYLTCSPGTTVDLTGWTVTPPSGFNFLSWRVGTGANQGSMVSGSTTCTTETLDAFYIPSVFPLINVTKTATPTPTSNANPAGNEITYTITATNSGGLATTAPVTVSDQLPAGETFVATTSPAGTPAATYDATTGTVSWAAPAIHANSSLSFTITVSVAPGYSGTITNQALWSGEGCQNGDGVNCVAQATSTIDTLTLNGNGGTFTGGATTATTSCVDGGTVTLSALSVPTETGYTFAGWSTAQGGPAISATTINCATETLYAQWTADQYTVTYDPNGGSGSPTNVSENYGSDAIAQAPTAPTRTGYSFVGWNTSDTATTGLGTYTVTGTITLFAVWSQNPVSPVTYTVTYDPNGGSVSPTSAVYTVGGSALTLPTPARSGYTFDGWFTAATGGSSVGAAGASFTPTGTETVFAQWTASGGGGGGGGGGGAGLLPATVSITNLPSAPKTGTHFTPTYTTNGDGTVFSTVSTNPAVCTVTGTGASTVISFIATGSCSLTSTVQATLTYALGTGTQTTQVTLAVVAGPRTDPLKVTVVGVGAVRSNVRVFNLSKPGSVDRRVKYGTMVDLIAKPRPGFVTTWSGACKGHTLTCAVSMKKANAVTVTFRPAVVLPVFYFATNMSNITMSAADVATFKKDLIILDHLNVRVLTIRAYADYRNGPSYNLALSQRRANSVTEFVSGLLRSVGITNMRFVNLGLGILRASSNLQLDRKAVLTYI